jgi:hypothetical protein
MRHVSAVNYFSYDRIGGVIVSVLVSSTVDREDDDPLKHQSADKHVAPLGHIILIPSQPVFALSP